jgi:hypothetical protein
MSSLPLFDPIPLRWERPRPVPPPVPTQPPEREELARIRELLGDQAGQVWSGKEHIRRAEREIRSVLPTGLDAVDRLLGGGLPKGKLLEIAGTRTAGRWSFVLAAIAAVSGTGEPVAVIDHGRHFDPQTAADAGAELERVLWIAPDSVRHCVAAAEVLLATGFPLVVIDLGLRLRGKRVHDAAWIRLAREAASYGASLVLSSPFPLTPMAAETILRAPRATPRWNRTGPPLLEGLTACLTVEKTRAHREGRRELLALRDAAMPRSM